MFCPKYGNEYRKGFYKCVDCDSDLVAEKPLELMQEVHYIDFIEVYSTYQQGDIAFIKSVLDCEEITYYFEGENSNLIVGGGAYARLLVKAEEAPRAREILQELGFLESN